MSVNIKRDFTNLAELPMPYVPLPRRGFWAKTNSSHVIWRIWSFLELADRPDCIDSFDFVIGLDTNSSINVSRKSTIAIVAESTIAIVAVNL